MTTPSGTWQPAIAERIDPVPTLAETGAVIEAARRLLVLPDLGPLLFALALAVVAKRPERPPVWGVLEGPPSSGKTELVDAFGLAEHAYRFDSGTMAGLLSGSPGARKDLLYDMDHQLDSLILNSDMTVILEAPAESRDALFGLLRLVYDGHAVRRMGTAGGLTLTWEGRTGWLGGVTEAIEQARGELAAMGERFVTYHVPEVDPATIIDRIAHRGEAGPLKQALAEAVAVLVASPAIRDAVPDPLTPDWQAELTVLATIATRLRTPVLHGPDLATSQYAPADESVGRLFGVLDSLRVALAMLGVDRMTAWTLLRRVAFDSVDARRMRVVRGLLRRDGQRTSDLAALVSFPTSMAGAILDELAHRGVVSRDHGHGSADWTLDGDVADALERLEVEPFSVADAPALIGRGVVPVVPAKPSLTRTP
jgi:hypothetical protein